MVSEVCQFWLPPRFNATDTTFPLMSRCISIGDSLVGSPPIFGIIGVKKSARTTLTLLVVPAIFSCNLGGLGGGFVCDTNNLIC